MFFSLNNVGVWIIYKKEGLIGGHSRTPLVGETVADSNNSPYVRFNG